MKQVTVEKAWLLSKVRENLGKYEVLYAQMEANFPLKVREEVESKLSGLTGHEGIYISFSLPASRSDSYINAIEMLEAEVGETIVLTEDEFAKLARNQWEWRSSFVGSYSGITGYSGSAGNNGPTGNTIGGW